MPNERPVEQPVGRLAPERAGEGEPGCKLCGGSGWSSPWLPCICWQKPNEFAYLLTPQVLWSLYVEDKEPPNAALTGRREE